MDVNSVMSNYSMTSLWNSMSPSSVSSSPSVPLIGNVDSSVQQTYLNDNYSGQSTDTELQDIFQQVNPSFGMPFTYDNSGNLTAPQNSTPPSDGTSLEDSNMLSLLQGGESSSDLSETNVLNQYNEIEGGFYQASLSSIMSSNPYSMYSSVNSLSGDQSQDTGSLLNATA